MGACHIEFDRYFNGKFEPVKYTRLEAHIKSKGGTNYRIS